MSTLNERVRLFLSKNKKKVSVKSNSDEIGKYLQKCIQDQIDMYYLSYSPRSYSRTGRFKYSLNDYEKIELPEGFSIKVNFNNNAFHNSLNGRNVFVPNLIDLGWCHFRCGKSCSKAYHFHDYDGYNFIEKGIANFKTKYPNVEVKVKRIDQWHGFSEKTY